MNNRRCKNANWMLVVVFGFLSWQNVVAQDFTASKLTEKGQVFQEKYTARLETLRKELLAEIPGSNADTKRIEQALVVGLLDDRLVELVVLQQATPKGLAEFSQRKETNVLLIETLLADPKLMKKMLVADGAGAKRQRRGYGPAQFGAAMEIYAAIRKVCDQSDTGILHRLALATSLEHAVPIAQSSPKSQPNAPRFINPVKRYLHYKSAYLNGELDPTFKQLSTWELRMVVNGDEPDETLAWGREMLRNYRPDHIYNSNFGWRYVSIVGSDVKYGSENVKHDRPELQKYQNILMNGGVCGRRAFFGRFILRAFGVPTIARPSRGHGALAHWTPEGWVVNLGGGWGCGWTKTRYNKDVDFLASTQARRNRKAYLQVKRAQWIGDVMQEERSYGEQGAKPGFWNGMALAKQKWIIEQSKAKTLAALGEDLGEANEPTIATKVVASPVTAADRKVSYESDGTISIPAAAYSSPKKNTRDVTAMKSYAGGLQVYLPRFFPQGSLRGFQGASTKLTSSIC